ISSGLGSSTEASCCVTRKIFLSPASASSSARTEASRPTIKGCIISGKITISRTGIIGTRFTSVFSRLNIASFWAKSLTSLLEQAPVDLAAFHHVTGDDKVAKFSLSGQVIHHLQNQIFQNHAQSARSHFALQGQFGHGIQRVVRESQPNVLKFKQPLILSHQSVFRFGQDAHER